MAQLHTYSKEETKLRSQGVAVDINGNIRDGMRGEIIGKVGSSGASYSSGSSSYTSTPNTSLSNNTNKYSSLADDYAARASAINLNSVQRQPPDMTAFNRYNELANDFMDRAANTVSTNTTRGQVGANKYQNIYESAYNALANREKFSYNQKDDPLYAQYEDMYTRNARMAMNDTIGVASAMTGGYGNSYAATAGQSMYNNTMQGLNEKALQLYDSALNTYNSETNRLATNFDAAANMYGTEQNNLQFIADLTENQYQYDQSYAQNERNMLYNIAMNYSQMGEGARQFDTSFAEQQYQNNVTNLLNTFNAYNNAASNYYGLYENARQHDENIALDRDKFNWQVSTDERDYNRSVFESDRAYDYQTERDKVSDQQFADNLKYNYTTSGFDYDPVTGNATRSDWYNNERAEDQAYRWASAGLSYDPKTNKVTKSDIAKQAETKQAALDQIKSLSAAGDYTGASQVIYDMEESGAFSRGEAEAYMDTYGLSSGSAGNNTTSRTAQVVSDNIEPYVKRDIEAQATKVYFDEQSFSTTIKNSYNNLDSKKQKEFYDQSLYKNIGMSQKELETFDYDYLLGHLVLSEIERGNYSALTKEEKISIVNSYIDDVAKAKKIVG